MGQLSSLTDCRTETAASSVPPRRVARNTCFFFLISFALVFGGFGVGRKMNVDENVFTASAAMLSRHFILPYRDYHYNHMPTLVILYALVFKASSYLLLAARLVSAICAAGAAAIFFSVGYRSFDRLNERKRFWCAAGAGVMFLANPLFTRTAGRAWNHDFPVLMSLLGFLVLERGLSSRGFGRVLGAGILVGLAVTARLTFATELAPFYLFIILFPAVSLSRRITLFSAFTIGGLIAFIPSIWFWAQSPANAYFGNFLYPALNTRWHFLHDDVDHNRFSLLPKMWYFIKLTWEMPGNGLLLWTFVWFSFSMLRWRKARVDAFQCKLLILVLLAASQIASGLVPSPPFVQYFYAATPFMLWAVIICLGRMSTIPRGAVRWVLGGLAIVSVGFAVPEYRGLPRLFWPPAWFPVQAHEIGRELAQRVGGSPVLTLDPLYPLEGGLEIYPELATGPFGMRVGAYLSADHRREYRMWDDADVTALFDGANPPAVMISPGGDDAEDDTLFAKLAEQHNYSFVQLRAKNPLVNLWLPPRRVAAAAGTE